MAEPASLEFRAMGSPCRVVVIGGPDDLVHRVQDLVQDLERRWSRFLPDSEISDLNRLAGAVTIVSEETYRLVSHAVRGHELTEGWFNPLMLDQLEVHGYRQPWDEHRPPTPTDQPVEPATTETITLYPEASAVRLPAETRFDPGGIGKGLAVDMAVEACTTNGATSASVEMGGDLRVFGRPWYGPAWHIGVANPFDRTTDVAAFTPEHGGAVTTSTTQRRRWTAGGRTFHHLLDPATGEPSQSDIIATTTCSSVAWWAEIVAKAALLAGSQHATDMLDDLDTPGIAITATGEILRSHHQETAA